MMQHREKEFKPHVKIVVADNYLGCWAAAVGYYKITIANFEEDILSLSKEERLSVAKDISIKQYYKYKDYIDDRGFKHFKFYFKFGEEPIHFGL